MPVVVHHTVGNNFADYLVGEFSIHGIAPEFNQNDVAAYKAAYGPGVNVEGAAGMHAFMRSTEGARAGLAREVAGLMGAQNAGLLAAIQATKSAIAVDAGAAGDAIVAELRKTLPADVVAALKAAL